MPLNVGYVYCIEQRDKIIYVGSTKSPETRFEGHLSALIRGNHPNKKLQKAFDPNHSLDFYVLDKCNLDSIRTLESYWWNLFISLGEPLCNAADPKHTWGNLEHSASVRSMISVSSRGKKKKPLTEDAKRRISVAVSSAKTGIPQGPLTEAEKRAVGRTLSKNGISWLDVRDWLLEDEDRLLLAPIEISKQFGCTYSQAAGTLRRIKK